jgi:hypothetical protein
VIDFVKNYSLKQYNEIQSQHYFSWQVTILVHLTFHIDPQWDETNMSSMIVIDYHFYMNDDKADDNLFIQHYFKLHWDSKALYYLFNVLFFWMAVLCNSCAKTLFCFVAHYPSLTRSEELPMGCSMQWNHYGSGHGKGHYDGARAHVK